MRPVKRCHKKALSASKKIIIASGRRSKTKNSRTIVSTYSIQCAQIFSNDLILVQVHKVNAEQGNVSAIGAILRITDESKGITCVSFSAIGAILRNIHDSNGNTYVSFSARRATIRNMHDSNGNTYVSFSARHATIRNIHDSKGNTYVSFSARHRTKAKPI